VSQTRPRRRCGAAAAPASDVRRRSIWWVAAARARASTAAELRTRERGASAQVRTDGANGSMRGGRPRSAGRKLGSARRAPGRSRAANTPQSTVCADASWSSRPRPRPLKLGGFADGGLQTPPRLSSGPASVGTLARRGSAVWNRYTFMLIDELAVRAGCRNPRANR